MIIVVRHQNNYRYLMKKMHLKKNSKKNFNFNEKIKRENKQINKCNLLQLKMSNKLNLN